MKEDKNPIYEFVKFVGNCVSEKNPIPFIILSHLQIEQVLKERLYKKLELNIGNVDRSSLNELTRHSNSLIGLCKVININLLDFDRLTKLRHKVAHQLDYQISEQDRMDFINSRYKSSFDHLEKMFEDCDYSRKEKEFRMSIVNLYSKISYPLYNKIKIPSLLGNVYTEVEVDDMRYEQNRK